MFTVPNNSDTETLFSCSQPIATREFEFHWNTCVHYATFVHNLCKRFTYTCASNIASQRSIAVKAIQQVYSVSQKKSPLLRGPDIFHFFHKRLRIFNRFFTHLLYVLIHARLQIFIQLSPILTKLCRGQNVC